MIERLVLLKNDILRLPNDPWGENGSKHWR